MNAPAKEFMNETITVMIQQFCGRLSRISAMIGAHDFMFLNEDNSLKFRFKMCKKSNLCRLSYDYDCDTYKMEFYRVSSYNSTSLEIFTDLYAEDLKSTFESYTGLRISL